MVEDQEDEILLIRLAFEHAGLKYPISSVTSGQEAIAYLSGDPPYKDRAKYPLPALVLLDIRMPRMDGFEVLKWIRGVPEFVRLPVVMLTGSEAVRDADTAYKLGATSFLVKPLDFADPTELSRIVERLISRSGS